MKPSGGGEPKGKLADKLKAPPDDEEGPGKGPPQRRDVFTVLPPEGGELVDLATNWTLLEGLASASKDRTVKVWDTGD